MLTARARGIFTKNWSIENADREQIAALSIVSDESADLRYEGRKYRIEQHSNADLPYPRYWVLREGDKVIFQLEKTSLLDNRYVTFVQDEQLELLGKGFPGLHFVLMGPDGPIGTIRRKGWLGRKVKIDISAAVPILAQLFFLFQAGIAWSREDLYSG